jgi:hypothetical protein
MTRSPSSDREECQRFVTAFGQQGAVWFAEGKSFEQAQKLYRKETRDERKKFWLGGMSKSLSRFAVGIKLPGQK